MPDKQSFTTIDEYIGSFPADVQAMLEHMRRAIQFAAPEATETISYGIPTFDLNGRHLIHFAGWKQSISVYPLPAGDAEFQLRIAPYKQEKSTLRFRLDRPIPYDLIGETASLLKRERQSKGIHEG